MPDIGYDNFPAFLAAESAKMKMLVERAGAKAESDYIGWLRSRAGRCRSPVNEAWIC